MVFVFRQAWFEGTLSRNGEGGVCWVGLPIEVEFPFHASHWRVIYNCENLE